MSRPRTGHRGVGKASKTDPAGTLHDAGVTESLDLRDSHGSLREPVERVPFGATRARESLRVLVAHSFYRLPGGEDRYVEQQVPLLRTQHEVATLWRHNRDLTPGPAAALRMALAGPRSSVEALFESFKPDVVHLHNAYPSLGPAVHRAAERAGVPLVMTVHNFRLRCPNGYMFTEGASCRRCEHGVYAHAVFHNCFPSRSQAASYAASLWVHRFILRLEDAISLFIAPSEFVRSRMIEWGIAPDRIEIVRNFTTVDAVGRPAGRHGIFIGRLSGEKGVDVLLRALAVAGDPPFRIVGDGPVQKPLESLARDLHLRNTVFLGRVPSADVPDLLRRSRYLVLPSISGENAPLAAIEALAAGRPLLVSDGGGLPELVSGGEGLLSPPGDVEALARRIRQLHDDDELWAATAQRAKARAAEFTPQRHLERLERAYAKVAALARR